MTNKIIDGLINSIRVHFEEDKYDIYTDNVEQGLKKPCFFIFNLQSEQQRKLKGRHKQIYPFMIQYMPENEDEPNIECNDVIPKLFEELEYITTTDGLLQTFEIKSEVVGGVLNCFVEYVVFTKQVENKPMMETKQVKGMVKNG